MPFLLTRNRQWVGMIGSCKARVQAYRCGPYLFYHHAAIGQFEKQISDLKCSLDKALKKRDRNHKMEISALKLKIHTLTECFDTTYQYDRFRVIELTQLICRNLVNKPPEIDSNRIFSCIKNCVHDYEQGWADNPEYLDLDVRMLLNVCRASTWFTSNQLDCFCSWCQNIDL